MTVSIVVQDHEARIMRGGVQIGTFILDNFFQIDRVIIHGAATPAEDGLIVRMAASHVGQFVVRRTEVIIESGVLSRSTSIPPSPDTSAEYSVRLLKSLTVHPAYAAVPARELEVGMKTLSITFERAQ